ncbi:MAG: response regulator [Microcoleus sp. PH2017_10_PVI_O_A]|uniref:response regulator n=2 Tax=unclassified Microcoleus TaxID=2642155 RepID=UPI001D2760EA|nr:MULTISPECIES: response regulator [unclassified Microcoleus]MCC3462922.1 response regulator [Microcoleus sp. PH2017_11_PCY_U_A]MCC3530986.1 response regulator [Microcoleus sp. PH2017_21_RUC_O_A]MCC3543343.1 response regulator [Microcoleus sp. PH2017_22_RUC_O_B]MCC3562348.1 response regulator [Microcoleus sp. PH2017_27_LUM_O_A]TAE76147.1 MAG: response regulator [Oscillatoriales cyanobacterium]
MNTLEVVAMTTKTILLIYKEPNMQEVVKACLTDLGGWNVRVANSTLEGLRQAILYQPDSIVLDISTGTMDEFLFLKQLSTLPTTQGIPVVLLTLKAKWVNLQNSLFPQDKIAAVIVNPLDPAMLSVQIAQALGWDLE